MYNFTPEQLMWFEALESGKYKQGRAELHNENDEYCCLGVACKIFAERLGLTTSKSSLNGTRYNEHAVWLPREVLSLLKLRNEVGILKDRYKRIGSLAGLNDEIKMSFIQIAHYMRTNPENVFLD